MLTRFVGENMPSTIKSRFKWSVLDAITDICHHLARIYTVDANISSSRCRTPSHHLDAHNIQAYFNVGFAIHAKYDENTNISNEDDIRMRI